MNKKMIIEKAVRSSKCLKTLTATEERIHFTLEKRLASGWELVAQTLNSITLSKNGNTIKLKINTAN